MAKLAVSVLHSLLIAMYRHSKTQNNSYVPVNVSQIFEEVGIARDDLYIFAMIRLGYLSRINTVLPTRNAKHSYRWDTCDPTIAMAEIVAKKRKEIYLERRKAVQHGKRSIFNEQFTTKTVTVQNNAGTETRTDIPVQEPVVIPSKPKKESKISDSPVEVLEMVTRKFMFDTGVSLVEIETDDVMVTLRMPGSTQTHQFTIKDFNTFAEGLMKVAFKLMK